MPGEVPDGGSGWELAEILGTGKVGWHSYFNTWKNFTTSLHPGCHHLVQMPVSLLSLELNGLAFVHNSN